MRMYSLKQENVFENELKVIFTYFFSSSSFIYLFFINLAAAKLANATLRNNQRSLPDKTNDTNSKHKHKHHHHHHHKKHLFNSPIHQHKSGILKSSTSNGSGLENFSTDDAEEVNSTRTPPSPISDNPNLNDQKNLPTSRLNTSEFKQSNDYLPLTGSACF